MVDMAVGQPDLLDHDIGLLDRGLNLGTSPPGSITTAFLVASHQNRVQFCSNSVTGMMTAPAFALVSVCVICWSSPHNADFLRRAKGKCSGDGRDDFVQINVMTALAKPGSAFRRRSAKAVPLSRSMLAVMESQTRHAALAPAPDRRQSETALAIARGTARLLRSLGFSCISELPLPSGRRADLVALNERGEIWIVEIKSSIEDLRADQKWPDYRAHCDRLLFAFTQELPCEIFPGGTGLIVADAYGAHLQSRSAGASAAGADPQADDGALRHRRGPADQPSGRPAGPRGMTARVGLLRLRSQ